MHDRQLRVLALAALVAIGSSACAGTRPASPPVTTEARTTAPPADARASVTAPGEAAGRTAAVDPELARAAAGYQRVERSGRVVYCREERATGALVPRQRCLSESQLLEQERRTQSMRDRLTRPDACGVQGCGNPNET